jgi:hypothetical protein
MARRAPDPAVETDPGPDVEGRQRRDDRHEEWGIASSRPNSRAGGSRALGGEGDLATDDPGELGGALLGR